MSQDAVVAELSLTGVSYISTSGPGVARRVLIPSLRVQLDSGYDGSRLRLSKYDAEWRYAHRVVETSVLDAAEVAGVRRLQAAHQALEDAKRAYEAACSAFLDDPANRTVTSWLRPPPDDLQPQIDAMVNTVTQLVGPPTTVAIEHAHCRTQVTLQFENEIDTALVPWHMDGFNVSGTYPHRIDLYAHRYATTTAADLERL